jgi:N-acetylgalactosamine kinase
VNLIGEHIDYNGFGVLPCAVDRVTVVAIGVSDRCSSKDICVSLASSVGGEFEVVAEHVDHVAKDKHHWSNYVLAAFLSLKQRGVMLPRGIALVVGGDLPQACGLSSSSSLVVACAMAMSSLRLSRQHISREMLAEICSQAEWLVGTAGGGMDQAAILLSEKQFASHIEFEPLRVRKVKLPEGVKFVVANSHARSAKAETADTQFNKRVFECKLAQHILRSKLFPTGFSPVDPLKDTMASIYNDMGRPGYDVLLSKCEQLLPPGGIDKHAVLELVGKQSLEHILTGRWGKGVWEASEFFFLLPRALHVFSEAQRVERFVAACAAGDVACMAACINGSGDSLENFFDCSVPALSKLVRVMRDSGCLAARLVGAGFGGCAVGMVGPDCDVIEIVKEINLQGGGYDDCFAFEPAPGAYIIDC